MDWLCTDCDEMNESPVESSETHRLECPDCGSSKLFPLKSQRIGIDMPGSTLVRH